MLHRPLLRVRGVAVPRMRQDGRSSAQFHEASTSYGGVMWSKIRAVLGALTDILTIGRSRGWWSRKPGPPMKRHPDRYRRVRRAIRELALLPDTPVLRQAVR